ncbi:MAG: DUF2335 domain-containing protein [Nitrospirota bacterium]
MGNKSKKPGPPQVSQPRDLSDKIHAKVQAFSGPLPPPALLEHYNQVQPGFAERIVMMAEEEANHRRACERKALEADIELNGKDFSERQRGQFLAFGIVLIIGGLGCYLAMNGHEITGSVFGGPAIASMVANFLGKKKEKIQQ